MELSKVDNIKQSLTGDKAYFISVGDYTGVSSILMDGNQLTRFYEYIFTPLVEGTGDLDISNSILYNNQDLNSYST